MIDRIPDGFSLLDPLEHCECCGNKFTQADLDEYRDEAGLALALGPDSPFRPLDNTQCDDFPEVCSDCAEQQALVTKYERREWSASP